MTERKVYSYHRADGAPLKLWDGAGAFEPEAMRPLENVARLPFIHGHLAGMPDVHRGRGATVGSVIATKGAIVPAAVGVDIGCGMIAVRTTLSADRLPDKDLAYLVERTELFEDYLAAVGWAQEYALENRKAMMAAVIQAMKRTLPKFDVSALAVNCHHNYVAKENHFGEDVYVTRKGAVRAREGDLGIIPGSMGTGSFIVEGRGNRDSFMSCAHGAGRKMSRRQAREKISLEQHATAMRGIEARLDEGVIDESPAAYKDIGAVMEAQSDLVRIRHRLRQIVNVKG